MEDRTIKKSILLSLLIHFVLVLGLGFFHVYKKNHTPPEKKTVMITLQPEKKTNRRIVDVRKGKKVKEAVDNAYLGKENLEVEKETVAKTVEGRDQNKLKASQKTQRQEVPNQGPLSKFGLAVYPKANERPVKDTPKWHTEDSMGAKNEYIKGLKESETTALNTKEYLFFGYFQRIRQQLDLAWKPILKTEVLKMYRKGRKLASSKEHLTKTKVVMNSEGEIVKVILLEQSGTQTLDEAAVRAFNKAGPFPNPPKGLVDHQGYIEINWDFILRT